MERERIYEVYGRSWLPNPLTGEALSKLPNQVVFKKEHSPKWRDRIYPTRMNWECSSCYVVIESGERCIGRVNVHHKVVSKWHFDCYAKEMSE